MTTGIVIYKPLFQRTDLIEAVRGLPLPPPSLEATETVAQDLTTDISLALYEQQVSDSRLARGAWMERLAAIDKAASRLLEELGYPTDLEAAQGWNAACPVGVLLAPGLLPPPEIAATLRLQALLGGTQSLLDRAEEARKLAELCGAPDEAPSAVRHAISRALAEAALQILPEAVAVLLAVTHAAQAQVANEPMKKGDRLDVAAPRVMQVTAAAFMRLFVDPQRRVVPNPADRAGRR